MRAARSRGRADHFGYTELPEEQKRALSKAAKLEWGTIAFLAVTVTLIFFVLGSSQAMRAAWVEDLLSFLPPLAFLIATRVIRLRPTPEHPYGFHRATGMAHLVAAVSLLTMGGYLIVDSAIKLITVEHPAIGGIEVFGTTIWLGWLMIAALAPTIIPPVLFGRAKMKVARQLHDRVLYADADMNKADWQTALAAIIGVLGIGVGLWWADSVAAILIALSITWDGVKNLKGATAALIDTRGRTVDDSEPHPVGTQIEQHLCALDWVADAKVRVRDQGHVFHVEAFVVPRRDLPPLDEVEKARRDCAALDWKVQDLVLVPVQEMPEELLPGLSPHTEQ